MSIDTFRGFSERKASEAAAAVIHPLVTVAESPSGGTRCIGNDWTRQLYDGDFQLFSSAVSLPAVSLVFVQSREGRTGADDPSELGGGATDKHLIYEGLSRVAADAVLAGAATASGGEVFFSLWHPQLVALRAELGLPRHPTQVVVSDEGRVDLDGSLLFNVADVPVFLLAGPHARERCAIGLKARPWITVIALDAGGLRAALARLQTDFGIQRISAIGGRRTASRLIDEGLVQDLCLTTTTRSAGQPDTPYYVGEREPARDLVTTKRGSDPEHPILFEHLRFRDVVQPNSSA
jgi:riboflavin biosynthesis pyrimidine reductase